VAGVNLWWRIGDYGDGEKADLGLMRHGLIAGLLVVNGDAMVIEW
jgi:hypothetical protein